MLDFSHLPTAYPLADVQTFIGSATTTGGTVGYQTWLKPRGKSMCHILLVGNGGNGGNGAIGANSTAAGGGGGASGAQTSILVPMWAIPDALSLILFDGGMNSQSRVSISTSGVANDCFLSAPSGGNGGNASGATAGAAGTNSGAATASSMPLGWQWVDGALPGQAGIIGGVAVAGAALTLPVTGLFVTGGGGGGGLPAAAAAGTNGGGFTVAGAFPPHAGGAGAAAAGTVPGNGAHGYSPISKLLYNYGGTGGGSTHGTATGAGLQQSSGGNGAPGCGGGATGGALTGSAAGVVGKGGPAFCVITSW